MKCVDCGEEYELGDVCLKCRLERLRKRLIEDGKGDNRNEKSPLPPSDRE
jgi:hypothetical protein